MFCCDSEQQQLWGFGVLGPNQQQITESLVRDTQHLAAVFACLHDCDAG